MDNMRLCAPCLFGLEGLLADELRRLDMKNVAAEDGRVFFDGGISEIAAANLWIRTGERVMILAGSFPAQTFDELFEGVKALEWERFIPADGAFPVRGHCVSSKLMSVPDCRSIIKKAAASRLGVKYGFLTMPEDGSKYQIRFTIMRDRVQIYIDTTGAALHKRGYRALSNDAPLRETLAAGLVNLSRYRGRDPFRDPFCGSGTIVIEAALAAKNRAPGLLRHFDFEAWENGAETMKRCRGAAGEREFNGEYDILGTDIDPESVALARENAEKAGVFDLVRFEVADAREFSSEYSRGRIVTNPPYGVRMGETDEAAALMRAFSERFSLLDSWEAYIISADAELEKQFGAKAAKKRKLYNGMLKCELFSFKK